MTPLRQRMINDMTVRGFAENTKRSYLTSVTGLARHYRRSPDHISAQEVQDYLLYLHEQRGLSWKSCNCVRHGVRFLYRRDLTAALREQSARAPVHKKHGRQEHHSVRWPWNRVVSGMLTAQVTRRVAVT